MYPLSLVLSAFFLDAWAIAVASKQSPNGSVGFQVSWLWGISFKPTLQVEDQSADGAGGVLTSDKARTDRSLGEFQQHRNRL